MHVKIDRAVRFFEVPNVTRAEIVRRVREYFDAGFSALCVIDTDTAEGAEVAMRYVEQEHLPMCIVPGATVVTSECNRYAVYGVVDRVIIPPRLPFAELLSLVYAHEGFLGTYPVAPAVIELEIPQLTATYILQRLCKVPNEATQ
jgi:hypothetical protein